MGAKSSTAPKLITEMGIFLLVKRHHLNQTRPSSFYVLLESVDQNNIYKHIAKKLCASHTSLKTTKIYTHIYWVVKPGGRVGVVSLVLDQSFNREKQKAFLVGFVF